MKVSDSDPLKKKGEFEDVSQVEKYVMSEEDYSKRTGQQLMQDENLPYTCILCKYVNFKEIQH